MNDSWQTPVCRDSILIHYWPEGERVRILLRPTETRFWPPLPLEEGNPADPGLQKFDAHPGGTQGVAGTSSTFM
jgi:hypothetical protein